MGTPRIGMVGYHISDKEPVGGHIRGIPSQSFSMFSYDMAQAIFQAGGVAIPLPVVQPTHMRSQIDTLDAIIFSGGEDIEPSRYGCATSASLQEMDPIRDDYELKMMRLALEAELPMLCICRGMQLLNVYFGGTLYIDIKESLDTPIEHWHTKEPWKPTHSVYMNESHFATSVFGDTEIMVNSIHHQAIDQLGNGLEIVGRSPDQVAEILAIQNCDHVLGVQWHPEMIAPKKKEGLKPFRWLVEKTM